MQQHSNCSGMHWINWLTYGTDGKLSYSITVEIFHKQAEGLKAGGTELTWIETISSADPFLAAADGVYLTNMQ